MDNIYVLKSIIKILYRELISNYSLKNDIDDYVEQIIYVLKYNIPWHLLKSNLHYSTILLKISLLLFIIIFICVLNNVFNNTLLLFYEFMYYFS